MTSLLQGVADVRNWIVTHIPTTSTMVGYDLFLLIGNEYFSNRPFLLKTALAALPYKPTRIMVQLTRMQNAGLVMTAGEGDQRVIMPTMRCVELLEAYQRKFESLFILRKGLREEQFQSTVSDEKLAHFAESLYDHFYDLGWLYLHNFGSICFLMASLVCRIAQSYGLRARIESGYVDIVSQKGRFVIGGKELVQPGQVNGHAWCVIEEKMVIDFGLGSGRKYYRRDLLWACAFDYQPQDAQSGCVTLRSGETAYWKTDWQSPAGDAELERYAQLLPDLVTQYDQLFR